MTFARKKVSKFLRLAAASLSLISASHPSHLLDDQNRDREDGGNMAVALSSGSEPSFGNEGGVKRKRQEPSDSDGASGDEERNKEELQRLSSEAYKMLMRLYPEWVRGLFLAFENDPANWVESTDPSALTRLAHGGPNPDSTTTIDQQPPNRVPELRAWKEMQGSGRAARGESSSSPDTRHSGSPEIVKTYPAAEKSVASVSIVSGSRVTSTVPTKSPSYRQMPPSDVASHCFRSTPVSSGKSRAAISRFPRESSTTAVLKSAEVASALRRSILTRQMASCGSPLPGTAETSERSVALKREKGRRYRLDAHSCRRSTPWPGDGTSSSGGDSAYKLATYADLNGKVDNIENLEAHMAVLLIRIVWLILGLSSSFSCSYVPKWADLLSGKARAYFINVEIEAVKRRLRYQRTDRLCASCIAWKHTLERERESEEHSVKPLYRPTDGGKNIEAAGDEKSRPHIGQQQGKTCALREGPCNHCNLAAQSVSYCDFHRDLHNLHAVFNHARSRVRKMQPPSAIVEVLRMAGFLARLSVTHRQACSETRQCTIMEANGLWVQKQLHELLEGNQLCARLRENALFDEVFRVLPTLFGAPPSRRVTDESARWRGVLAGCRSCLESLRQNRKDYDRDSAKIRLLLAVCDNLEKSLTEVFPSKH